MSDQGTSRGPLYSSLITEGVDRSIFAGEPEPPNWISDLPGP